MAYLLHGEDNLECNSVSAIVREVLLSATDDGTRRIACTVNGFAILLFLKILKNMFRVALDCQIITYLTI